MFRSGNAGESTVNPASVACWTHLTRKHRHVFPFDYACTWASFTLRVVISLAKFVRNVCYPCPQLHFAYDTGFGGGLSAGGGPKKDCTHQQSRRKSGGATHCKLMPNPELRTPGCLSLLRQGSRREWRKWQCRRQPELRNELQRSEGSEASGRTWDILFGCDRLVARKPAIPAPVPNTRRHRQTVGQTGTHPRANAPVHTKHVCAHLALPVDGMDPCFNPGSLPSGNPSARNCTNPTFGKVA